MDDLSGFDFAAVGDDPHAFEYKESPSEHIELVADLEAATRRKDLPAVIQTYTSLRQSNARLEILRQPGGALYEAVKSGREDTVRYLLTQGVQVLAGHVRHATQTRSTAIMQLLLENGWQINQRLGWNDPPALAYAVEDPALTAWFLAQGADPNAPCALDKTPLSAAVELAPLGTVQMLLASGGNIERGQLLHFAVWRELDDRPEMVRYLLAMGARPDVLMYHDMPASYLTREAFGLGTPLHDAAALGDMVVIRILLENGADPDLPDSLGYLAYERALRNHHDEAAQFLLTWRK